MTSQKYRLLLTYILDAVKFMKIFIFGVLVGWFYGEVV